GLLVNQTDEEVTIKTAEGVDRTIPAEDIEEMVRRDVSLMPENLHQLMTVQELVDMVDYLVLLKKKTQSGSHIRSSNAGQSEPAASHESEDALAGIEIADDLSARLFSAEPELRNPSNIDVDHLGRVWVCEVVNYRHFRNPNNPVRSEGDRILVLEDTDHDGAADKSTVFYQGNDVNSAHGICVLGDRVIISAGDQVCSFFDDDGDLVADRKEMMFSGIGGVEHDHGIHAFVPGPDGKLYFNFGNEGHQIKDADGNPIVDRSGREVRDHGKPYQQGMVFRCDLDGSNVETLAWNFRNNWELCVDSFGTIWQSDNDDDGNRATRINYVMPFGNYGYRGEMDGSTWRVRRTGMHEDIPLRHWHLRDPGVIPNVVQTGAGSPTGIIRYEGETLPSRYHNELLHCDPGPNSVRMYQIENDGAGYIGEQNEMLTGTRDRWFRPVDVCVAPDGSLFVADWYDPGVGGHRMGDTERGRIFRVTGRDGADRYDVPEVDFETLEGTIAGLKSPNVSTRFLAAERLRQTRGEADVATVIKRLTEMARQSQKAYERSRALWVLASLDTHRAVRLAAQDDDPHVRCAGIRIAKQHGMNIVKLAARFAADNSPQVRREAALSLRGLGDEMVPVWVDLAKQHDGNDRWYVEALGIAADGNWDACLTGWIETVGDQWDTRAGRDLIWRSRASMTSEWLAKILAESEDANDSARYLRAFDFQPDTPRKQNALRSIAEVVAKR
ncbi:PVC-type heme-binding CxxCH protein, partial [Rhodopirellula sallentina]|uniref:PVC-type heme-binding CxxCH protein n=1 Tax=Rhodopirellula sallentina TaxID=1263869 RepID=UPI0005C7BB80